MPSAPASRSDLDPSPIRTPVIPPVGLPAGTGIRSGTAADSAFMRACRREPVPHTPVWFMRQAGRSLPEYRALREGVGMLESCMRADLVTELAGSAPRLPSGPLHDASEMARVVPTAMLFVRSLGGVSHTKAEDSPVEDLELAVRALYELTRRTAAP